MNCKVLAVLVAIGMTVSAAFGDTFYGTRDNGINNGDAYDNQGARSTVRTAKWGCDEAFIVDFDTAAILSFMGGNPIGDYTFTLYIMPSGGWPASPVSVDVQTINTNQDWAEGDDPNRFNSFGWTEGTPAATSEYAQTYWVDVGGTPTLDVGNCIAWQREDGTPESRFKYLPASYTNSTSLSGSSADHGSYISVVLDNDLVNDLLNNAKNRGLRLYRNAGDNLENYTREAAANQRPYLEVVYAGGPGPEIFFAGPATDGSESATPAHLRVELSESSSQVVRVDYAASGGTAQGGGVDYTLAPGTLEFQPGETVQYIDVTIVNDPNEEPDETIVVTLSDPVNGTLGSQTTHTYTILDQDRAGQTWNCSTVGQMEYAWRNCQPNDEIVLAAGTYVLEAVPTISTHHVIMRGATGDPDDVILTGPGMNTDLNPRTAIVVNADNFTLMDLTIQEVYHNGVHIKGENDVDRVWITNVKTFNCGERHLKGSRNPADTASDSEETLIEFVVMEADKAPSGHPDNNYVGGMDLMAMKDLIIRDCVAINIRGATGGGRGGIFLWQENYNPTVERNKIYDGDSGICLGNPGFSGPGHCVVGGIVRNNFVTRGAYIALELCFTKDVKVYHNSIYSDDANYFRTVHIYGGSTTNLQSKFNIIRGQIFENGASWTDEGSIIGTAPQPNWFVDWTVADLHLTANATPAIDTASPLAEVPEDFDEQQRGSLPDKGGDESNPPGELPTVTLSATDPDAAEEGQDAGTFTSTRDQTSGNLTVHYSVGGTAEAADYEETLSGSVTILDGQASTDITITPVDDSEVEGDETVILTLTADPAYTIGSPNSGTVTIADNDQAVSLVFERGVAINVSSADWTTVNLTNTYTSQVVVCSPNYDSSYPALVVRVTDAAGSSFKVRLGRADGQTGTVTADVHYLVVEEGVYNVGEHGVKMEAAKFASTVTDENNSWVGQPRSYSNAYTSPVVLGQVMSYNDADWSVFWCCGSSKSAPPSSSTLKVGKHVGEDPDTTRNDETIGYIVIEAGSGSMAGVDYVADLGSDSIRGVGNSPPYSYSLSGLSSTSAGIVSQAAMDGGNGGWAILYGSNPVTTSQLNLAVDEDQMNDSERKHTAEQVGYIVFE